MSPCLRGESFQFAPRAFIIPCLLLAAAAAGAQAAGTESPAWLRGTPPRLEAVPQVVGPWRMVAERALDAESRRVLAPDATLWRLYRGRGVGEIDFLVVYGHRKQTFHSPAFCIPGEGYQVITKRQVRLPIPDTPAGFPVNAMTIQKADHRLLVCYWYAQGGETTPGLVRHTMRLMWRRLTHQPATGALIRVITPVPTTEAAALRTVADFTAASYPAVRREMKAALRAGGA